MISLESASAFESSKHPTQEPPVQGERLPAPLDTDRITQQEKKDSDRIMELRNTLGLAQQEKKPFDTNIHPTIANFFAHLGEQKTVLLLSHFSRPELQNIKEEIESGDIEMAVAVLKAKKWELDGYPIEQMVIDSESEDPETKQKGLDALEAFNEEKY